MKYHLQKIIFFIVLLIVPALTKAQDRFVLSQYFQNAPALNPAFTGIDDFLNIQLTYRDQWSGFNDAPKTNFIGVFTNIRKQPPDLIKQYSLRISDPSLYDSLANHVLTTNERIKHGIGGYIVMDKQGPYNQIGGYLNYAIHIPLNRKTYLSAGIATGVFNNRLDLSKIDLRNPDDDQTYQSLLAQGGKNTSVNLNAGFSIYNRHYYIGYSAANVLNISISSDEIFNETELNHIVMGGINFPLGKSVEFMPSGRYNFVNQNNKYWDANVKIRVKQKAWAGLSYRSTKYIVFMGGVYINNLFNLSYAYDLKSSGQNTIDNGTHEIILGLMLYKKDYKPPFLW